LCSSYGLLFSSVNFRAYVTWAEARGVGRIGLYLPEPCMGFSFPRNITRGLLSHCESPSTALSVPQYLKFTPTVVADA